MSDNRNPNQGQQGQRQQGPNAPRVTEEGVTVAAPPQERPRSYAGDKVTVACKLPRGANLRIFQEMDDVEQGIGGQVRAIKRYVPIEGQNIVLKGNAVPFGREPIGLESGGYALTYNVDREFMETWLRQNKSHPWVTNKLIFISESRERAMDEGKEKAAVRSGLEPIAQEGDPRTRNLGRANVSNPTVDADNMKNRSAA
jgi:hypothetical protein